MSLGDFIRISDVTNIYDRPNHIGSPGPCFIQRFEDCLKRSFGLLVSATSLMAGGRTCSRNVNLTTFRHGARIAEYALIGPAGRDVAPAMRSGVSETHFISPFLESACIAQAVPSFDDRNCSFCERLKWMARERKVVESRPAFRLSQHLQGDLASKVGGARHTRTAVAHRVIRAVGRLAKMGEFIESISDQGAPHVAHRHIPQLGKGPQ